MSLGSRGTRLRVTVVTPSLNQDEFIRHTIESVLAQDGMVHEHLVMDGGSTDNTLSILKEFENSVVWSSESDSGQSEAMNKGLARSSGEIIGWLNSDDTYDEGAVAAALQVFEAHHEVDVVYGDVKIVDRSGDLRRINRAPVYSRWRLLSGLMFVPAGVFFRRELVDRVGGLDQSLHFAMDTDFFMRAARAGAVFFRLDRALCCHRLCQGTKTSEYPRKMRREWLSASFKNGGTLAGTVHLLRLAVEWLQSLPARLRRSSSKTNSV